MHKHLRTLGLFAGFLLTSTLLFSQETSKPAALDEKSAEEIVRSRFNPKEVPGLSVAVMHNGKLILARGFGLASIGKNTPVTPKTRFPIGSVTKQFTSACILLLAEDGKLSVQDKVSKYYPKLTSADNITLLDLMNHVSGYPDYYPLDFLDRRMTKPIAPDKLLSEYAGGKLDFEPGTNWSYSNTGFVLLARVAEKVTGESFGSFMKKRIFDPIGMTDTVYEPDKLGPEYAERYTTFALSDQQTAPPEAKGWVGGAGAIYSTPTDLAKWDLALMDGKVLKPESYKLMTTPRLLKDGDSSGYGCGLGIGSRKGAPAFAHGGAVSGSISQNVLYPATRSAYIYFANTDVGNDGGAGRQIETALLAGAEESQNTGAATTTANAAKRMRPKTPAVAGPPAADAAKALFTALQAGNVDAIKLSKEFRFYLNKTRLAEAAKRLKPLGKPKSVQAGPASERGGMEVRYVSVKVGGKTLGGALYRMPDGTIEQWLVR